MGEVRLAGPFIDSPSLGDFLEPPLVGSNGCAIPNFNEHEKFSKTKISTPTKSSDLDTQRNDRIDEFQLFSLWSPSEVIRKRESGKRESDG